MAVQRWRPRRDHGVRLEEPPQAGPPESLSVATSSDGVPVKLSFVTVPRLAGQRSCPGQRGVRRSGGPRCRRARPEGGNATTHRPTVGGGFTETVPDGGYTVTAFPPAETSLAQSTSSRSWAVSGPAGVAGANVTMPVLQPLPAGVSIGGQDGGVPVLYSGGPAPMTVRGCPHGVGAVEVRGTNDLTGKQAVILVPLLESPRVRATTRRPSPQYGRYTATSRSPMTSTVSRR